MPGSVANASPSTVLPNLTYSAFSASRTFLAQSNAYRNGERQVALRVSTSRKSWEQSRRLSPAEIITMRTFYDARGGPNEPFYFYDTLTHKSAVYDATGTLSTGRYTVRFANPWEQTMGMGRGNVNLSLVEVN